MEEKSHNKWLNVPDDILALSNPNYILLAPILNDLSTELGNFLKTYEGNCLKEDKKVKKRKVIAYVDGSYSFHLRRYSYGDIIIDADTNGLVQVLQGNGASPKIIDLKNVAGELAAAKEAIKWAIANNYKEIEVRYDFEGIKEFAEKKQNEIEHQGIRAYCSFCQSAKGKINITFTKVKAHSGNAFNEVVDMLARNGIYAN